MSLAPSRTLFLLASLAAALALAASFYLEYVVFLRPCLLCIIQRGFLGAFAVINLLAFIHHPARLGSYLYWMAGMCCVIAGAATAARQVVLLNVPTEQLSNCLPSLEFMLHNLSVMQALSLMFEGAAECVEVNWTLFELSVPEWSLLFFLAMLILGVSQCVRLWTEQRSRRRVSAAKV